MEGLGDISMPAALVVLLVREVLQWVGWHPSARGGAGGGADSEIGDRLSTAEDRLRALEGQHETDVARAEAASNAVSGQLDTLIGEFKSLRRILVGNGQVGVIGRLDRLEQWRRQIDRYMNGDRPHNAQEL